jgi:protein-tyrosine-phosphatase
VVEERGLSLGNHRSKLLTPVIAKESDLVLVMSRFQARTTAREFGVLADRILVLGDLDPGRPDSRTILDPLGHSKAFFREVYDRMDRCLEELALALGGSF